MINVYHVTIKFDKLKMVTYARQKIKSLMSNYKLLKSEDYIFLQKIMKVT